MRKKLSIGFIILLFVNPIQSQQISLSIVWKEKELFFESKNGTYLIPFLEFSYTNSSKKPLYFFELTHQNAPYFKVFWDIVLGSPNQSDLTKELEKTQIGNIDAIVALPYISESVVWKFFEKENYTKEIYQENCYSYINDKIHDLTKLYILQEKLNILDTTKQLSGFSYPDKEKITYSEAVRLYGSIGEIMDSAFYFHDIDDKEYIKNEIERLANQYYYIFLSPNETYKVEYDLTPLFLLGGKYEFRINKRKLPAYIIYYNTNTTEWKTTEYKYKLPKEINGYKLYDEELNACSVSLYIPR